MKEERIVCENSSSGAEMLNQYQNKKITPVALNKTPWSFLAVLSEIGLN